MILTVTLNPSVDKLYLVDEMRPFSVTRVKEVVNTAGGKGLNVSRVASLAGESVIAMGFVGGHNGALFRSLIQESGIRPAFTETSRETRCCVNVRDVKTNSSTEFLEPGNPVSEEEFSRFFEEYRRELEHADVVAISGSVPAGLPQDVYVLLIEGGKCARQACSARHKRPLLRAALPVRPRLVKPNAEELHQLTGADTSSLEACAEAARLLRKQGRADCGRLPREGRRACVLRAGRLPRASRRMSLLSTPLAAATAWWRGLPSACPAGCRSRKASAMPWPSPRQTPSRRRRVISAARTWTGFCPRSPLSRCGRSKSRHPIFWEGRNQKMEQIDLRLVPKRTLNNGEQIPCIGMGTFGSDTFLPRRFPPPWRGPSAAATACLTAPPSTATRIRIGPVLEDAMREGVVSREDLFIVSKVWNDMHGKGDVLLSCAQTLKDLRLDYLDAYFVHWPFANYHARGATAIPATRIPSPSAWRTSWRPGVRWSVCTTWASCAASACRT